MIPLVPASFCIVFKEEWYFTSIPYDDKWFSLMPLKELGVFLCYLLNGRWLCCTTLISVFLQTCRLNTPISNVLWWFLLTISNISPPSIYLPLSNIKRKDARPHVHINNYILFELPCYFLSSMSPWINTQPLFPLSTAALMNITWEQWMFLIFSYTAV